MAGNAEFRGNPTELYNAGDQMLQTTLASAADHAGIHSDMESTAVGLPTDAAPALQAMIASWSAQRDTLHAKIADMGTNTQQAAVKYASADDDGSHDIDSAMLDLGL